MADLELNHIQMFAEEGDPGWYDGQLPDGRRVHAAAIPCAPGVVHWSGSVEDATACECDGAGACNLCLIRAEGGLVFTRVTGCYRSANSAVYALQHWAAHPDTPQPPAPFNCGWTTMQAILCDNEPDAAPMPLGTTENPILLLPANQQTTQDTQPDSQQEEAYFDWVSVMFDTIYEQIQPETLDECTELGHPAQAWMLLLVEQEQGEICSNCGRVPQFRDRSNIEDMALPFDYVAEVISGTQMMIYQVIFLDDYDDGPVYTFKLLTEVVPLPDSGLQLDDRRLEAIRRAYGGNASRCRRCRWIIVGDHGLNDDGCCAHCVVGAPRRPEFHFPPQA